DPCSSQLGDPLRLLLVTISSIVEIGVGLVGFGMFFLLFGILLYMDSVLLAFGNELFPNCFWISGLTGECLIFEQ
ncbi:hypothetical protein E2320_009976, partial [Naja naja]